MTKEEKKDLVDGMGSVFDLFGESFTNGYFKLPVLQKERGERHWLRLKYYFSKPLQEALNEDSLKKKPSTPAY